MMIRGYDITAVLKTTWKEVGEDKVSVYAGQMAYAAFFSLFPLVLFFAALLSLVGDASTVQGWFNSRLAAALPGDVAGLLGTTIQKVIFAKGAPGLLSLGLLTAAWSGSGVFGALRVALNDAYDVQETRPLWKQYALQLMMLGLTGIVLLTATVILLNGEGVMGWIGARLGLSQVTKLIWTVIQFPLAIASLVGVLWLIYYFLPNCPYQDKKILLLGSSLATALWIAATLVFRVYVQKFNALNPAYGALGAIMLLLTWLYYSAFALLAVGELNAVLESKGAKGEGWERAESGGVTLAHLRADFAAARREVGGIVRSIGAGAVIVASGTVIALLGTLSLVAGVILLLGDQWLPSDLYWLAALVVALVTGGIAVGLARRGKALVRAGLARPRDIIASVQEIVKR
jgi:membrane protein